MAMHPTLQALSVLFPLRHYFLLYANLALNGYPLIYAWHAVVALLIFMLLPFFVLKSYVRLCYTIHIFLKRSIMEKYSLRHIIRQGLNGLFYIFRKELKATIKDQGVLIFFLLVPLAYPLIYAFIYTNEVVREVPTAVVDANNSSQSRKYIRMVDGSPDVHIQSYCADMEEARLLLKDQRYMALYISLKASVKIWPKVSKLT